MSSVKIKVTFPVSRETRTFRSIRAVARMLSGDGTASGGLREQIMMAATIGPVINEDMDNVVRNNTVLV